MEKKPFPVSHLLYVLAAVLALATMGCGIYQLATDQEGWPMVAAGCLGLVAVLATWPVANAILASRTATQAEREAFVLALVAELLVSRARLNGHAQSAMPRADHAAFGCRGL